MSNLLDELAGPEDESNKSEKESKDNNKKIINTEKYILNDEQKIAILKIWNESLPNKPPGLKQIYGVVFLGETIDHRSQKGLAVRQFLAERQLTNFKRVRGSYDSKQDIELTDELKQFIAENASRINATEIAREWLKIPDLPSTTKAVKRINDYLKTLDSRVFYGNTPIDNNEKEVLKRYEPPKIVASAVNKINKYSKGRKLENGKLSSKNEKCCISLINYMHTLRFLSQINSYKNQDDRDLFESGFVRWTCDKPDLTEEDIDQLIVWAIEVVSSYNQQKQINALIDEQNSYIEEGKNIPMSLVESISSAKNHYKNSVDTQAKLYKTLTEERGERLKNRIQENASILNLVELWKTEEDRVRLIRARQEEKKSLEKEVNEMMSRSELEARLLGMSPNEMLYG